MLIKPKNYQVLEFLVKPWYSSNVADPSRKHRLGAYHKATLNKQSVLCRVIQFERMTSYILEDYMSELGRFKVIKMKQYMVPTLGYSIKDTTLMIFQNEYISLYELLYSQEREELRKNCLDMREKYSICLQISKIFATLHQFNPSICHGHLTSHNIFLEQ